MATVLPVEPRAARRVVVAVLAATGDIVPIQPRRTQPHPIHYQEEAVVAVVEVVAPRSHAGREQVRLLSIHPPKCGHLLRFEKT